MPMWKTFLYASHPHHDSEEYAFDTDEVDIRDFFLNLTQPEEEFIAAATWAGGIYPRQGEALLCKY